MCVVNFSCISKIFNEEVFCFVVSNIVESIGWFLEIVNFNIVNMQYVCVGDFCVFDIFVGVINYFKYMKIDIEQMCKDFQFEMVKEKLVEIIQVCVKEIEVKFKFLEFECGFVIIFFKGIDVFFYFIFLWFGVKFFRSFLFKKIK